MELLMAEMSNAFSNGKRLDLIWPEQQQKDVFHQFELVNKFNLEDQNPRRDTSIPGVSAGLPLPYPIFLYNSEINKLLF